MAPVYIKVIPSIKDCLFECDQIYRLDDTTLTWREVFERIGLRLDPLEQYWIRNSSRKVTAVEADTVEDFIKEFVGTMHLHVVHITKANKNNWVQHSERTAEANAKRQSKAEQAGTSARSSSARIVSHASDASGDKPTAAQGARFGTSSFVEDGPDFPGFEEDVGASGADVDVDDSASMLSQDSQDDGGNLKASIIRKLGDNVKNGDLVLAKEEFQEMKERGESLRVARHIPRGLALLDVFFGQ